MRKPSKMQQSYARELEKKERRIIELETELDITRRLLLRSVGERIDHAARLKKLKKR
jgi:hypothetical protein